VVAERPFVCSTMRRKAAERVSSGSCARGRLVREFLNPQRNPNGASKSSVSEANLSSPEVLSAPSDSSSAPLPEATGSALLPGELEDAIRAAQSKKAEDLRLFDLRGVTSLTEFFLLCSGTNQRQNQAISDEILRLLKESRNRMPLGVEGYDKADWILMDYGDFIVHVLSGQARKYYDLERLWRQAKELPVPEDSTPSPATASPR
jgi:ribosome-associated protein